MGLSTNVPPISLSAGHPVSRSFFPDLQLRVLTWLFYAAFVVLWFKDNVDVLKKYRIGPLVALIPLVVVVVVRLVRSLRRRPLTPNLRIDAAVLTVLLLLLVTTVVRWPYLLNGERMMTSDDGVAALMGKHIAEGKLPPICFYGQTYLGSLSNHVYAVFFSLFGYSIPVLKFATLLFYWGFVIVQFLLLKDLLSFSFAAAVALFYSLPFGQLILVSLDNSSAHGLVLFLGASLVYTATVIAAKRNLRRLPLLGFLVGLAFWTHPILVPFILVALLIQVIHAGLRFRNYGTIAVYAALGGLPLLFQEAFGRFRIIEFLTGGEKGPPIADKIQALVRNLGALMAPEHGVLGTFLLVFSLAGVAVSVILTVRSKGRSGFSTFLLFLIVFGVTYWFSRFSDKPVARYLYPLYFCLPVFLVAPFALLKSRLRVALSAGLVATVTLIDGWPVHNSFAALEKKESAVLREVARAMRETGVRYWQAEYWHAYILTAISGEDVIVDTPWLNRYLPYRLDYYNRNDADSYVFLREPGRAENFASLLTSLGVPFKRRNVGDTSFFYEIGGRVFASMLDAAPPSEIPTVTVSGMREKDGYLEVTFRTAEAGDHSPFRINLEIPGYSEVDFPVPSGKQEFNATIPVPRRQEFAVRYELDFRAAKIPSTMRELAYRCGGNGPSRRTEPIVFLQGISLPVTRFDQPVRDCRREVVFEAQPSGKGEATLHLEIVNPFDFWDMKWYGRYEQAVRITAGEAAPVEIPLRGRRNVVELRIRDASSKPGPERVTMTFRYHFPFDYAPNRLIAAFLTKAEIIDSPRRAPSPPAGHVPRDSIPSQTRT
jgi:hypothetical protein